MNFDRRRVSSFLAICGVCGMAVSASHSVGRAAEKQVPVIFSGGHTIGKEDFGRPVTLIAAALGVKPDVFRMAFSGVTPARGRGPTAAEARKNKGALLDVLAPHGVTNERLDEVSDYYRFRPDRGELWPTRAAKADAVVVDGKITRIVVTVPGAGYCTPPTAKVKGFEGTRFNVVLALGKDLKKNGGVAKIEVVPGKKSK
jgi:hypothetical protein